MVAKIVVEGQGFCTVTVRTWAIEIKDESVIVDEEICSGFP